MKTHPHALRVLILAALFAGTGAAQAELSFYSSQAGFQAAVSAPRVDSFDDMAWAVGPTSLARTVGEYSYFGYSIAPDGMSYSSFYNAGVGSDVWLSTNQSTDVISLQFYDKVYGVGGYFFGTDLNGGFMAGQSIKLDARDADGHELTVVIDNATPDTFYGFASGSQIRYFEISALQPVDDYTWAAANDLTLGGLAAAVPEPASYAMLIAGGLTLVSLRARRRRSDR